MRRTLAIHRLHARALRNHLLHVDVLPNLRPRKCLVEPPLHQRNPRRPSDEHDNVHLRRVDRRRHASQHPTTDGNRLPNGVVDQLLKLPTRECEEKRIPCRRHQGNGTLFALRQLLLLLLREMSQRVQSTAENGAVGRVRAETREKEVHQLLVEVLAAQLAVAIRRDHVTLVPLHANQRDVECAAAQVVDENVLHAEVRTDRVGKRRSHRLLQKR